MNTVLRSCKLPKSKHTQARKVTLRGLLSHTAGLGMRGYPGCPSGAPLPTVQQILEGKPSTFRKPVRVVQAQGTGFLYSGGGYMVVQLVLEDTTGRTLADLAQALIIDKLGMAHSIN